MNNSKKTKKSKIKPFEPEVCECCGQTTTYTIAIDKGSVEIVKQIARFIGKKGINAVHPRKEMEGKWLTSNQVGNLTRPRSHGLIAKVRGNPGNYLLTRKGAKFLKGSSISRIAVMSKKDKKQIGYFKGEIPVRVNIKYFNNSDKYWEGINYEISEGNVITKKNKGRI